MNFADVEKTWHSPDNRPSVAELEQNKMQFITDLRRRRRGALLLLCLTFLPLAFWTVMVVAHVIRPDPALDSFDFTSEWGIVPFFLLPWLGWLMLLHLYRRQWSRHHHFDRSVHASLIALVDENQTHRTRTKLVAALLIVSVLLLPLIVSQLRTVGKAGDEILIPAYVIYPLYVLLVVGWMVVHYRRKLLPRKRELEALLDAYR